jgi:hypothetical protein
MADGVYFTLFTVISVCCLASFAFSRSIQENSAAAFVKAFRRAKQNNATTQDILAIIPAARATRIWSRFAVILAAWAMSFLTMVAHTSGTVAQMPADTRLEVLRICDATTIVCMLSIIGLAVSLLMHRHNSHLGF